MFWVLKKNRLSETVLLSTHNICFDLEIKKIFQTYYILSGHLIIIVYFQRKVNQYTMFEGILVFTVEIVIKVTYF